MRKGFAFGIEGYGSITDIGNGVGTEFQPHRIGPVICIARELKGLSSSGRLSMKDSGESKHDDSPKFGLEPGVLFGRRSISARLE